MDLKALATRIKDFFSTSTPRPLPRKIWCFYADPYKKGLAATGLTGGTILAIIIIAFLVVAIITLLLYILAWGLMLLAVVALGALALSGAYGFKHNGWAGVIGLVVTISIVDAIHEFVFDIVKEVGVFAQEFSENLNYFDGVYQVIATNIVIIIGVILAPAILVLIVASVFLTVNFIFNSFEKLVFSIYGIRHRCPECGNKTEPAIYRCVNCNHTHPIKLMPGKYGVFSHACTNCGEKMPTMLLFGNKKKLPHSCPNALCTAELTAGVLGKDKHIAFIGGTSSGKTCLLLQTTQYLLSKGGNIPEIKQERDFSDSQEKINRGEAPLKTQKTDAYRAFQVEIKKGAFPYHLHFYDVAGENFEDSIDAKGQHFFKILDSIAFVFDPFYSENFRTKHKIPSAFEYSNRPPLDIMRNLAQALEKFSKHKKDIKKIPLNVMMVKTDIGYLKDVVDPSMTIKESSAKIRQYIEKELEEGAFLQLIDQYFSKITFHYVSALGRTPSGAIDRSPFVAENLDVSINHILKGVKVVV